MGASTTNGSSTNGTSGVAASTSGGATTTTSGSTSGTTGALPANEFQKRYIFYWDWPLDVTTVVSLMQRGAAVGYNGIVLHVQFLDQTDFNTISTQAQSLGMAIIPIGTGDEDDFDASTDEAVPVRGSTFVVSDNTATAPATEHVQNGGFESGLTSWIVDSECVIDATVAHSGRSSLRCDNPGNTSTGDARAIQTVAVQPWHAYLASAWIQTGNLNYGLGQDVLGDDGTVQGPLFTGGASATVSANQTWTQVTIPVWSADNSQIDLYWGAWNASGGTGSFWLDDVSFQDVGLLNTLERQGSPVTVTSSDGTTTYTEGTDFTVASQALSLPSGSSIPGGSTLSVSWYQAAGGFNSFCEPGTWTNLQSEAEQVAQTYAAGSAGAAPPALFFYFDEWRTMGWDPLCTAGSVSGPFTSSLVGSVSAGQYLADTSQQIESLLWTVAPTAELYTWSDMYNPNENGTVAPYFLSNGGLTGGINGLAKSTLIFTWDPGSQNLEYFSQNGLRQVISGYYDSLDNVSSWLDELDTAEAAGTLGVVGFMYTTWDDDFSDLENAASLIQSHSPNRWGTGPAF